MGSCADGERRADARWSFEERTEELMGEIVRRVSGVCVVAMRRFAQDDGEKQTTAKEDAGFSTPHRKCAMRRSK